MTEQCCLHCLNRLTLGLRALSILRYLVKHPEWERDHLSGVHFKFLNGNDPSRVTYQEIGREHCEEAA